MVVAARAARFPRKAFYLAQIDSGLGLVYAQTKRHAEGEKLLKKATAELGKSMKANASSVVRCEIQLAKLYRQTRRSALAKKAAERALEVVGEHLGHNTYPHARALAELASALVAKRARRQAAKTPARAFAIVHKLYGSAHPRTKRLRAGLESLYKSLGWKSRLQKLPQ